jgi:dTDP-glucose 4,6-dehydratase
MAAANPLTPDLDHILAHTQGLWESLRGQRIFLTGGTGFFGCWLLESFAHANAKLGLNASVMVLTRNVEAFLAKAPHLASNPAIHFQIGDVRSFEFPKGEFRYVIHAATEASAKFNEEQPTLMYNTIVEGTRRVLDFARAVGTTRFLLTSSGAVNGPQPPEVTHVPEDFVAAKLPANAYAEGKCAAEELCKLYALKHDFDALIARCWAFVGPYLPLDIHFAIGNFIRDALKGGPIIVKGDGTPYRSYLYASDLAIWLWTILFKGQSSRAYNVGSEKEVSIREVAGTVAAVAGAILEIEPVVVISNSAASHQLRQAYLPSTERARQELGLREMVPLSLAISRTLAWHRPELSQRLRTWVD